ncbi:MAG: alpha-1,2-fucosyltransferase [Sphingobacteriaceae bacterium]|nr:alpha-1,2-fucosyltransferase [Cytophagaceae bacterium]
MTRPTLTLKLIGGLGNQLFAYATAKALALHNDARLVLDGYSGYRRDAFGRQFELNHFQISDEIHPARHPFGHEAVERVFIEINRMLPRNHRRYFLEKLPPRTLKHQFQPGLRDLRLRHNATLQGNFTSPRYFDDHACAIRQALQLRQPPCAPALLDLARRLSAENSVAVHFRLDRGKGPSNLQRLSARYYERAFEKLTRDLVAPQWFCFADAPERIDEFMVLPPGATLVSGHSAPIDLWLMQQCRHAVISASTFAWWGAWLGEKPGQRVLCPSVAEHWDNLDVYPDSWEIIPS